MKRFQEYITEVAGQAGLDYELKIYKAISQAKIPGLTPGDKPAAGFSNVGAGDIEAVWKGKPLNIEVKLSANDQMGGGSLRYDMKTKTFTPAKQIDPSDLEMILDAAKERVTALDNYIKAARKLDPKEYHKKVSGVPLTISKKGRDELKNRGLLQKINTKVVTDAAFIEKHYNKKGVFYIQIGGAGLFYLGKNPYNLPVPRLKGEIQIEIRLAFAGGGSKFPDGTENRTAGLRFQGRLRTKGKSPHSIDTVNGIKALFTR